MPKSQKPKKKYKRKQGENFQPILAHGHCPAEVRYGEWGPHKAQLYCLAHKTMIMWLSPEMAPKWEQALKTSPGITSSY